jgi:AraC-like DNA-binding protein
MDTLKALLQTKSFDDTNLPFSIYSSYHEQNLLNVPIIKPLLIVVISGEKELVSKDKVLCKANQFVFLSDTYSIGMRNIPKDQSYFALLIEFEFDDFNDFDIDLQREKPDIIAGPIGDEFKECITQFVQCSTWANREIIKGRRREILNLLAFIGYTSVFSLGGAAKLSHRVNGLISINGLDSINMKSISSEIGMSESTLQRKLKDEGTNIKEIKDRARMGYALHLLQTTSFPIGLIAEKCGYTSQSKFSTRFKFFFGVSPKELKNTKIR